MRHYKLQQGIFISTLISTFLFFLLTIIAMIVYPGGTSEDHYTTHYIFHKNYFSDLGRAFTYLGESNATTHWLFTSALTLAGLGLIALFIFIIPIYSDNKATKWLSIIGSINGVIVALAYIGIGFAPYDLGSTYMDVHVNFVYISFTGTLLTLVLYTIATFIHKKISNFYAWVFVACVILSIGYLVLLYGDNVFPVLSGTVIQAVGQKIIVYAEMLTFMILAIGMYRTNKKNRLLSDTSVIV